MNLRTASLVAAAMWAVGAAVVRAGIVQAEYFAGSDPGVGLASPLVLTNATNGVSADLEAASIPLSGLAPGTHDVGVRVKDSAGRWSTTLLRRVRVYPSSFSLPDPSPVASNSNVAIVAAEYFVGADPGAGAGTALGVSADGAAAQLDEVRPLANTAAPDVYTVGVRVRDYAGRWSVPLVRRTRVVSGELVQATVSNLPPDYAEQPQPPAQQTFLVAAPSYFLPGERVRIGVGEDSVEISPSAADSTADVTVRLAAAINAHGVLGQALTATTNATGLAITTKEAGLYPVSWLTTSTNLTTSIGSAGSVGSEGRRIVAAEFFVGQPPTPGEGTPLEFSGTDSNTGAWEVLAVPVGGIPTGTYKWGVRFKNAAGHWGNAILRGMTKYPSNFAVDPPTQFTNTGTNGLAAAEYFVGRDPGPGKGSPVPITSEGASAASGEVSVPHEGAAPGTYDFGLRFRDKAGRWGNPLIRRATVYSASALNSTISNLASGGLVLPEPAARQIHRIDLAGAFRCGQTFSVTIGGKTLEVPARPFETAANFLQRLAQAINSDPIMASMVQAATDGANSLLLTAKSDGWRPSDWVGTSAGLRSSLVSDGSLGSEGRKIVAAEYFVGLTPAPGSGTPMALNTTNGNTSDFGETALPIVAYRGGPHFVGVRFKNAAGFWGQPVIRGFTSYVLFGSQDTNSPAITLNGDAILSIPYASVFSDPGATATDDVDGDLTSKLVVRGQVDTAIPGDYELQYWCEDTAGNRAVSRRTVRVTDTTQPVFEGAADVVHTTPPATVDLFAGLRAVDAQFGDLSYRVKLVTNNVNWFTPGTYSAQFEVKDPAGNTAVLNRNITLGENAVFYPGFQTWMSARGALAGATDGQMQAQADPDSDGRNNLQEWQADTDPFNRWSALAAEFSPSTNGFRMSWPALQRIVYTMESSTNMTTWLPMGDPITYGTSCILDAEIPRSPSDRRRFYRVKAAPKQPLLELPVP